MTKIDILQEQVMSEYLEMMDTVRFFNNEDLA